MPFGREIEELKRFSGRLEQFEALVEDYRNIRLRLDTAEKGMREAAEIINQYCNGDPTDYNAFSETLRKAESWLKEYDG